MAELGREIVGVAGRQTAYFTGGDGEPLVFLHGGGIVEGVDCFSPLADRFRFIAPQMPGFDRTELRPPIANIDELVEHNARLLDELGVGSFALVGHSLGGWVAASFAAAHPERVRSLVIAAPYGLDAPLANTRAMSRDELYAALTSDPTIFAGRIPEGQDAEFDAARALEGTSIGGFVPGPFDPSLPGEAGEPGDAAAAAVGRGGPHRAGRAPAAVGGGAAWRRGRHLRRRRSSAVLGASPGGRGARRVRLTLRPPALGSIGTPSLNRGRVLYDGQATADSIPTQEELSELDQPAGHRGAKPARA